MRERQNEIVRILQSSTVPISVKNLSELIGNSTRTIRNEIRDINLILNKLCLSKILINRGVLSLTLTSKEMEMFFEYEDKEEYEYLLPDERFIRLILDFLTNPGNLKVYKEQEILDVSKSTMDQDMRKVRLFLNRFGLKIITQKGVFIEGEEKNIRTMLQQLIMQEVNIVKLIQLEPTELNVEKYKYIRKFLGNKKINNIKQNYDFLLRLQNYNSNTVIDSQIICLVAIWLERVSNNHVLKDTSQDINWTLPSNYISDFIIKLIDISELIIPKSEMRYIYYLISSLLVKSTEDIEIWSTAQILTLQLIQFMSEKEQVSYHKSEQLFEQLNIHMVAFEQRRRKKVDIYNPLTSVLKKGYKMIFDDVRQFMDKMFSGCISENEIAYISVYFSTYFEKNRSDNKYYRVAILCNYGLATGRLLAVNLKKKFEIEIVSILGMADKEKIKDLNIDFVIKTIDTDIDIPSLKMSPIMSSEDFKTLEYFMKSIKPSGTSGFLKREYNNLIKEIIRISESDFKTTVSNTFVDNLIKALKKHNVPVDESEVRPMIETLLSDQNIQLQVKCHTWKDAIEQSAKPLLRDKAISENYIKAMIKAVIKYGAYIVIGPGIALAHARPEEGANKLGVSVVTLKDPIKFGSKINDPVKIVFCLSAVDNYSHLNVMKSIVSLLNQPEKIDEMTKTDSIYDFKKILFEE